MTEQAGLITDTQIESTLNQKFAALSGTVINGASKEKLAD